MDNKIGNMQQYSNGEQNASDGNPCHNEVKPYRNTVHTIPITASILVFVLEILREFKKYAVINPLQIENILFM